MNCSFYIAYLARYCWLPFHAHVSYITPSPGKLHFKKIGSFLFTTCLRDSKHNYSHYKLIGKGNFPINKYMPL